MKLKKREKKKETQLKFIFDRELFWSILRSHERSIVRIILWNFLKLLRKVSFQSSFFRVALYRRARFPCVVLAIKLRTYTQTHARMTIHTHLHTSENTWIPAAQLWPTCRFWLNGCQFHATSVNLEKSWKLLPENSFLL